jgi:hypothetical protein
MSPVSALPRTQGPVTCSYPEPDQFIPRPPKLCIGDAF